MISDWLTGCLLQGGSVKLRQAFGTPHSWVDAAAVRELLDGAVGRHSDKMWRAVDSRESRGWEGKPREAQSSECSYSGDRGAGPWLGAASGSRPSAAWISHPTPDGTASPKDERRAAAQISHPTPDGTTLDGTTPDGTITSGAAVSGNAHWDAVLFSGVAEVALVWRAGRLLCERRNEGAGAGRVSVCDAEGASGAVSARREHLDGRSLSVQPQP